MGLVLASPLLCSDPAKLQTLKSHNIPGPSKQDSELGRGLDAFKSYYYYSSSSIPLAPNRSWPVYR